MPAEVVNSCIIPEMGHEQIRIMDDYGTEFVLCVRVCDADKRLSLIDDAIARQNENEAAIENYAQTHGLELTAQKLAGLTKKQNAKG